MRKRLHQLATRLLVLPLIRLEYSIELFLFRRTTRLRLLLRDKLSYLIRVRTPDARLEGYDEEFDALLHLAITRMITPEIFDPPSHAFLFEHTPATLLERYKELKDLYERSRGKVDHLTHQFSDDPEIRRTIVEYRLVASFVDGKLNRPEAASYQLSKAKELFANVQALEQRDLFSIERSTRKDIHSLRDALSDGQSLKISLSLSAVTPMFSVASSFFLITGYLYNHFLLSAFGIEVSKYFRLSDYLASSIDGIRYSASSIAFGIVSYFAGAHFASRRPRRRDEPQHGTDSLEYVLLVLLVASVYWARRYGPEAFYPTLYAVAVIFAFSFGPRIARRYFDPFWPALFVIVFVISFSAHIYTSVAMTIHKLKHYEFSSLAPLTVTFKDPALIKEKDFIVLAGTSDYFFLLNKQRRSFIVSRQEVLHISGMKGTE